MLIEISIEEKRLLEHLRVIGWGEVVITVKQCRPTLIKKTTKTIRLDEEEIRNILDRQ